MNRRRSKEEISRAVRIGVKIPSWVEPARGAVPVETISEVSGPTRRVPVAVRSGDRVDHYASYADVRTARERARHRWRGLVLVLLLGVIGLAYVGLWRLFGGTSFSGEGLKNYHLTPRSP